jgi:hypothetical protein
MRLPADQIFPCANFRLDFIVMDMLLDPLPSPWLLLEGSRAAGIIKMIISLMSPLREKR